MSKLENVGLSEIVLESFPNGDNFDYFLPKKTCKKRHQEINHTLRTADKKMNNEVDEVLGLYPEVCQGVGPVARRWSNIRLSCLICSLT